MQDHKPIFIHQSPLKIADFSRRWRHPAGNRLHDDCDDEYKEEGKGGGEEGWAEGWMEKGIDGRKEVK